MKHATGGQEALQSRQLRANEGMFAERYIASTKQWSTGWSKRPNATSFVTPTLENEYRTKYSYELILFSQTSAFISPFPFASQFSAVLPFKAIFSPSILTEKVLFTPLGEDF